MNSLSIKFKLILLAVLAGVGMLAMVAIQISATHSLESLEGARLLVSNIESDMLMLRRNEKDFLARTDMKYKGKFTDNAQAMRDNIQKLKVALEDNGIDTSLTNELQNVAADYEQKFLAVVDLQSRIGLHPKDGLYGSLRNAVHQAEELVNARKDDRLTKDILMLRRREKDFMLRMDLKYLEKFDKDLAAFHADLKRSNHPNDIKQEINAAMLQYQQDFHALVDAAQEKGLNSKLGVLGSMRSTIHKSEEMLAQLGEETGQHVTNAISEQRSWSMMLAGLITLIIVAMATVIPSGLFDPLSILHRL